MWAKIFWIFVCRIFQFKWFNFAWSKKQQEKTNLIDAYEGFSLLDEDWTRLLEIEKTKTIWLRLWKENNIIYLNISHKLP